MNVDIKCNVAKCETLGSQDAPITNASGSDLAIGDVYYKTVKLAVVAGNNSVGDAIASGEIGTLYTLVPMAKAAKKTGEAWAIGADLYWDGTARVYSTSVPANDQIDLDGNTILAADVPASAKVMGDAVSGAEDGWIKFNGVINA